MTAAIEIRPVEDKRELTRFIRVPYPIYEDDPHYVVPLEYERRELLSEKKNPYFKHATAQYWTAYRNGQAVGRISAQIDDLVQSHVRQGLGHFGMFECIDDPEVAGRLFETAEAWLKERGMTAVHGPFNVSVNGECGLLIGGFDLPPRLMMGHARPYYRGLVEGAGYTKAKDLFAYTLEVEADFPPVPQRIIKACRRNRRINYRMIDMKNYEAEIQSAISIFNDAWRDNWGFVPFTEDEAYHLAKNLKPFVRKEAFHFCDYDGEPAAMMITLPNINDYIRDLNGKLWPFGWMKFAYRMLTIATTDVRVPLMGVRKEYQTSMHGAQMAFRLFEETRILQHQYGVRTGELSWVLEDNPLRHMLDSINCTINKTYRIFGKELA